MLELGALGLSLGTAWAVLSLLASVGCNGWFPLCVGGGRGGAAFGILGTDGRERGVSSGVFGTDCCEPIRRCVQVVKVKDVCLSADGQRKSEQASSSSTHLFCGYGP